MSTKRCPACGSDRLEVRKPGEYRYLGAGLTNVYLCGGVTVSKCPDCKAARVTIFKEWQLLQVIALDLLGESRYLFGAELRFLRSACRLTQAGLALRLRIPRRATIAEREASPKQPLEYASEIVYRRILLGAFMNLIGKPGENHLAPSHMKRLNALDKNFWTLADGIARSRQPRLQVVQGSDHWELRPAA
ncbi:MAG: hypothetical protein HZB25_02715 [Candidatus Eisenbacteria bacterium]|nr:hypothetical protein [Candidatus Eisenbacteria bacterium]